MYIVSTLTPIQLCDSDLVPKLNPTQCWRALQHGCLPQCLLHGPYVLLASPAAWVSACCMVSCRRVGPYCLTDTMSDGVCLCPIDCRDLHPNITQTIEDDGDESDEVPVGAGDDPWTGDLLVADAAAELAEERQGGTYVGMHMCGIQGGATRWYT